MYLFDAIVNSIKMPSYIVEIGVLADKSGRKEIVQLGINNAELMYIHENGSPLRNIPARPVLDLTIAWVKNTKLIETTFDKALDVLIKTNKESEVDKVIDRMCLKIQSHARHIIYDNDGTLAANSPGVAARKKGNHPLFDTGQLARSITCRAIKIKKGGM